MCASSRCEEIGHLDAAGHHPAEPRMARRSRLAEVMDRVKVGVNEYNKQKTMADSRSRPRPPPPCRRSRPTPDPIAARPATNRHSPCGRRAGTRAPSRRWCARSRTSTRNASPVTPSATTRRRLREPPGDAAVRERGLRVLPRPIEPAPRYDAVGVRQGRRHLLRHLPHPENSPDYVPAEYVPKVIHWDGATTGR